MDGWESTSSSPAFVSAQQSPADADTPRRFLTPPSSRGSDSASSLLAAPTESLPEHRDTVEAAAFTKAQSNPDEDGMPPITRQQERANAAQSAPVSAAPADSSSPTVRARPVSPITHENILRDASPHSASYASQLQSAVDKVTASLMQRRRTDEAHAVQELYNQSFKDPGSRVLLDALLRNRLNDRQSRDFKRYVQDVTRLGHTSKASVSAISPETSVLGKRNRDEAGEPLQADESERIEANNDGGVKLTATVDDKSTDVAQRLATSQMHNIDNNNNIEKQESRKRGSLAVQTPNRSDATEQIGNKIKKSRVGKGAGSVRDLGSQISPQDRQKRVASGQTRSKAHGASLDLGAPISATAGHHETGIRNLPATLSRPTQKRRQQRKKKNNKMFHGANGPVYSRNILGLPE